MVYSEVFVLYMDMILAVNKISHRLVIAGAYKGRSAFGTYMLLVIAINNLVGQEIGCHIGVMYIGQVQRFTR